MEANDNLSSFLHDLPDAEHETYAVSSGHSGRHSGARKKPSLLLTIVGVIGELLICAGVLVGLFIVWQMGWTNMKMSNAQDKAVAATQKQFGDTNKEKIGAAQTGEPPAIDQNAAHGSVLGLMHIPRLAGKQTTSIYQGESLDVLAKGGYGHYTSTAMPGQKGNFSVAIHRDTYGSRALHIDRLKVGDPIVVETQDAWYVYKFTDYEIVDPTDVYVVSADPYAAKAQADPNSAQVEANGRYLTITTCHPPMVSNKRWVVHAEFQNWVARKDGIPQELVQEQQEHSAVESTGTSIRQAINDSYTALSEQLAPKEK